MFYRHTAPKTTRVTIDKTNGSSTPRRYHNINGKAPAVLVRTESLGGSSVQLPSDKLAKPAHESDQFSNPLRLPAMALPIISKFRGPVLQIPKDRIEVSNGPKHSSDAHGPSWTGPLQYPSHFMKLSFEPVHRMVGQIADVIDQSSVVPFSVLPQLFQLQVMEKPSMFVDESKMGVAATEDDVIR